MTTNYLKLILLNGTAKKVLTIKNKIMKKIQWKFFFYQTHLKKVLRIMKLSTFLLLICVLNLYAGAYSQDVPISVSIENGTLADLFNVIENNTEYKIFYKSSLIDESHTVNLTAEQRPVSELLAEALSGRNLSFDLVDKVIIITASEEIVQQQRITGKVTDAATGEPMPGVNILIKGTSIGTISDLSGNYSLDAVDGNATLVFSFIGYVTQEILPSGRAVVNVALTGEMLGLDEVVVIGYGTAKKSDLTGSITTVSTKDFVKTPASTPLHILQGRASGVQITTSSGMPGSSAEVEIRGIQSINGTNAPIYVVDGVIRTSIDNLNPNSIEAVSILKDASAAAIYGARAANGVILVTTKRGTYNTDIKLALNTYLGFQTESNLKLKLLNADQWLELFTEAYENSGTDLPWNDQILSYYDGVNTDWVDLVTQTGVIQNYDLSLSGGSEKSNYFVSGSFQDHKGMVIETKFNKYTLDFNSDHKINDWIKVGNSLSVYSEKRQGTNTESGLLCSTYNYALRKVPITRAYEDDGDYGKIYNTTLEHMHQNSIWMAYNYVNEQKTEGLFGNLYIALEPLKNLVFTARGNMDYNNLFSTYFTPSVPQYYGWEGSTSNMVEKEYAKTIHWSGDFLVDYSTIIGNDHNIKILLGYSLEENKLENLNASRTGTPNNEIQYLSAGDPTSQLNTNTFTDWSFTSIFSRFNYSFRNKYLLTATVRRDGTSRLYGDNKFGIFPSASVAWRISEEGFMKSVDFVNDLKLRLSYGTLGNILSVGSYGTIASLTSVSSVLNNQPAPAYTLQTAVNSDLKWESALKKNFGIDATFLNSKLYSTIDLFIEDTYDLLFSDPIPYSTGLSGLPLINAGKVRNTGYEIELGYRNQKSDWSYDFSFNLSHVKNEVVDLGGRNLMTSGLMEGFPVYSFFGYKSDGIITDPGQLDIYQAGTFTKKKVGDVHLLDIDGYDSEGKLTGVPDGKVDAADRTFIGNKYPNFTYGLLGSVGYKNWSLQIQLQGVQGIDIQFMTGAYYSLLTYFTGLPRNEDARILDRYHPTKNPDGSWPRLDLTNSGNNTTFSEFWLQDASYLRVKNLNLNYNLPQKYCNKINMDELGLYLSVQNAYTFTKYDGPEVDSRQDAMTGVAQPRTWTLGLRGIF